MPADLPQPGDPVVGTDGPFSGFKGTVTAVNPDNRTATVSIVLFGRETAVPLPLSQLSWPRDTDPAQVQALLEGLRADARQDRVAAAEALGKLGLRARSGAPGLAASLAEDPRAEVRAAAAAALGTVDPAGAEPALLAAARADRSGKVIAAALESLAHADDPLPRLKAPVLPLLRHPRAEGRAAAVRLRLRGRASDASLVPEILSAMAEEADLQRRRMLALLLGRIGVSTPDAVAAVQRLAEDALAGPHAYDDAPWFVLGTLGAADVLAGMLDDARYPPLARIHAAKGLCMCRDGAWVPDIVAVLEQAERGSGLRSLIERVGVDLGPLAIAAAPALARAARQEGTRDAAAVALAMIGATDELAALLRDGDDPTRAEAAHALARGWGRQLDDALRVPAMVAALADPLDRVRRSAAEFLRNHRDAPGAAAALAAALATETHALTRQRLEEALAGG